jgi:hypothetical protein
MVIHFSDNAPHEFQTIEFEGRTLCGLERVFATSNGAIPNCPDCQDRLARIASRAPVLVQSEERDEWVALDNSANRPHVLHVEVKAMHRGALVPEIAKDFSGQLWEREDERSATMLGHFSAGRREEDNRGPLLSAYALMMPNTYGYYATGKIRAGVRIRTRN